MKLIYRNEWTGASLVLIDDHEGRIAKRMEALPSWQRVS